MNTLQALLEQARLHVEELEASQVLDKIQEDEAPLLIDVREHPELVEGSIPGAIHIPRGELELRLDEIDNERAIVFYCAGGTRSLLAAKSAKDLGRSKTSSLKGGFHAWKREGHPLTHVGGPTEELDASQRLRYARHLSMPEVGERGQRVLLDARVLLVGAGGLGSPAALYLAAAGVGTLGIIDFDVVDSSNLQRQILHREHNVGQRKTASAAETLHALNPEVRVERFDEPLSEENVDALLERGWDVILDGSDNFATRYALSDAARRARLPVVHASIARFTGQLITVLADSGPCYRCVYGEEPDAGSAPTCQEAGVLGVLPGVLGTLQATEVLKLLLNIGRPLSGALLMFDALEMRFREFGTTRDPSCPACNR